MKLIVLVASAGLFAALAQAQNGAPEPQFQAPPLRDPWVPEHARKAASAPPTEGAALRAQVEAKLRATFDAADAKRSGTLTREQAKAAGLGYVAEHFDRIDTHKSGRVSFDDVKRYLRSRGAAL
jgi:hypothetical protein